MVTKVDFVGIPSQDAVRSRAFYVETLGLRRDSAAEFEVWAGDTCFGIWEPEKMGRSFEPVTNPQIAFHVDDVVAARKELEAAGVRFFEDTIDTGVCRMAFFTDPDGNLALLHSRYAPRT
jgi:catechol 2,3-dioxygenase-like lactoylglutathione lyase family enzyme